MITRKSKVLSFIGVLLILFLIFPFQKNQVALAEETSSQGTVVASSLNVRESADISSKVIGLVQRGDTFDIIQSANRWDQIKLLNNKMGWVYHDYLTPTKNIEATVEAKVLNVREKPSLSSKIVGQLKWGTKITIQLEQAGWGKMVSPSGAKGWVNESYITKNTFSTEQIKPDTVPPLPTESVQKSQGPLKGKTIVLDPGHGGIDPGTKSILGTPEKTLTLETAKAVEQKLVSSGANVIMTRTDDTFISLQQRAEFSNQNHADAFISFHYNWSKDPLVNGLTGFFYQTSKSSTLATDLLNEIVNETKLNNVGTKLNNLSVLRNNLQPSTLIELGFVSNKQDDSVIESPAYRDNVAEGVYQGLLDYFSGP